MLKKLVEVHPRGGKKQSDSDSESEGKKFTPQIWNNVFHVLSHV